MAKKKTRADGLVEKTVTINGKRKHFYGHSEAEVLRKIADYSEKQEAGATFKEVAESWEKIHFETIAYNSIKVYKPAAQRAVDEFGHIPAKDITPAMIFSYIKRFSRNKAQKTVANQLLVIRLIFEHGLEKFGLLHNPAISVKAPKGLPKTTRPYPTKAERETVTNNTDAANSLFMRIALRCGLRRGEICALTGASFDKEKHILRVTKSVYWVGNAPKIKAPKTEKGTRIVPVPDDVYKDLIQIECKKDDPIFAGKDGGFLKSHEVERIIKEYKESTNTTLTPHSYRHGYASALHDGEIDVLIAKDLLGHAQASTTLNVYTHIDEINENRAAELRDRITKIK